MSLHLLALSFEAHNPDLLASFWSDLLGREVVSGPSGALLPGSDTQVGLRFVPNRAEKAGPNRVHLHLTSTSLIDQQDMVAQALDLGADHVDVGQLPEEGHVVMADPEGNEFCVIEPRNSFLLGCGLLGEVACEGTREVGHFWAEVLGWPLVWDQHKETAVQSPRGGTKVAWGGQPVVPRYARNRQRFDLVLAQSDLEAEVERLAALGAGRLGSTSADVVELADPDGNEFCLAHG